MHETDLHLEPNEASDLCPVEAPDVLERRGWDRAFVTVLDEAPAEDALALLGHDAGAEPGEGWQAVRIHLKPSGGAGKTQDAEACARRHGHVYALGSQFGSKAGPLSASRSWIARVPETALGAAGAAPLEIARLRFAIHRAVNDALTSSGIELIERGPLTTERYIDATIARGSAKGKRWAGRVTPADHPINVEGIEFRASGHLLLGLRYPVSAHGHPLLVELDDVDALFADPDAVPACSHVWELTNAGDRDAPMGIRALHTEGDDIFDAVVGDRDAAGKGAHRPRRPPGRRPGRIAARALLAATGRRRRRRPGRHDPPVRPHQASRGRRAGPRRARPLRDRRRGPRSPTHASARIGKPSVYPTPGPCHKTNGDRPLRSPERGYRDARNAAIALAARAAGWPLPVPLRCTWNSIARVALPVCLQGAALGVGAIHRRAAGICPKQERVRAREASLPATRNAARPCAKPAPLRDGLHAKREPDRNGAGRPAGPAPPVQDAGPSSETREPRPWARRRAVGRLLQRCLLPYPAAVAAPERGTDASDGIAPHVRAVEYARGVYRENLDYNRDLYTRAQIVLTLDGVLLGAVGAALASNATEVDTVISHFSWVTWVLLSLAAVALLVSVVSATRALYSRHRAAGALALRASLATRRKRPGNSVTHDLDQAWGPWNMWYFGGIAEQAAEDFVAEVLRSLKDDLDFEARVRLAHVSLMSKTMVRRADQLNRAFVGTALALMFFAFTIADYLLRVSD